MDIVTWSIVLTPLVCLSDSGSVQATLVISRTEQGRRQSKRPNPVTYPTTRHRRSTTEDTPMYTLISEPVINDEILHAEMKPDCQNLQRLLASASESTSLDLLLSSAISVSKDSSMIISRRRVDV